MNESFRNVFLHPIHLPICLLTFSFSLSTLLIKVISEQTLGAFVMLHLYAGLERPF